jgi:hypothetical protein
MQEENMPRRTVGEELQSLFSDRECGLIEDNKFQARKKALLEWSKCDLSRFVPRRLRRPPL